MYSLLSGAFTLAVAALFWVQRSYQSQYSGMFPDPVILLTALLGILLVIRGLLKPAMSAPEAGSESVPLVTGLVITAIIFAWAAMLRPLGFLAAGTVPFFAMCRFARTQRSGWRGLLLDLVVSIASVFLLYFIFTEFLLVRLPRGSIW